ncbi:ArsR/SmtB family transcription factor [Nakamurella endophytica]|uniref:Transcriptional regulator n=1 Tax=Nakamurella endophytica TaxID=1748367 RepID=A0A917T961_9ACTN|nr:metalloregulator ArsR/SmtB family transcription factor [Nakamurella endophytica]GGM13941.1 transcriptional regulator [Nakamurella endophytica]
MTLTRTFAVLADDTRWRILQLVGEQDLSASALAKRLPVSRQAIAKHLSVLQETGLVEPAWVGRELRYRAAGAELSRLAGELEQIARTWDRRLAAIKAVAESL